MDLSHKGGLKVIAAGLPRCGTTSLQSALENELGFKPCIHMVSVMPHTDLLKLIYEAQNELEKEKRQKILHKLFDGYVATTDFPGSAFADDLMEMYPEAKVILNQRSSALEWHKSFSNTLKFSVQPWFFFATCLVPSSYWKWKVTGEGGSRFVMRRFGIRDRFTVEFYYAHNDWIRDAVKKNGNPILEWQVEQGWEPLCTFLGKPVPDKAFPHLNDANAMSTRKNLRIVRGLRAWAALLSLPALLAALAYFCWPWFSTKQ